MIVTSALRGCFEPVAYALVADVCTPAQRIDAFGIQRMGTNVGWAVGPALGGTLTLLIPYGAVFYVAAAGMIVAAIVTMRVADPVRTRSEPRSGELRSALASSWKSPRMRLLLIGTFLSALLQTQMFSTFSIFMTAGLGLGKSDVGLLYTINGVFVLALQIPAVAALRRFGLATALPWSSLVNGAGFLAVGIATGFWGGALAMVAITVGEVLFAPAHQTAIAEIADPVQRGRAYGVVGFAQMLGIAVAPFIGGALFDAIGHHHATMWSLIASIGIAQALCFAAFVRKV
jgi:predicted MFS family arabinose efflux permease